MICLNGIVYKKLHNVPIQCILDNPATAISIAIRRIKTKLKRMEQKLIVTIGLPASGKTTWSKSWVEEDHKNRIRINRDDIRRMLGPYWLPSREDLVTEIENKAIIDALWLDYSVVVDATNFRGTGRFEFLLKKSGFGEVDIEIKDFTNVPIEICIDRDKNRKESVGEQTIMRMYNKYLK